MEENAIDTQAVVPVQTPPQDTTKQTAEPTNYHELLKTDKSFQSFIDTYTTKATDTAVQNAIAKQQRLSNEKLSESDRLKVMTADEKASYFEQKYKQAEMMRTRDKEVESLKSQTVSMLSEKNIPNVFLSIFDFANATVDEIKQRVSMLSEYEYYPKGELEKRIVSAVDERLKQKSPETHAQPISDPFLKGFNK